MKKSKFRNIIKGADFLSNIDNLDKYTAEEDLINYFCKLLGFEKYEENPRDKDVKNLMMTAKLTARDLRLGKYLNTPPEGVHEDVPMGAIIRTNHRVVESVKELSYKGNNLVLYKTTSYSTVGESDTKYDYMIFLDIVKK